MPQPAPSLAAVQSLPSAPRPLQELSTRFCTWSLTSAFRLRSVSATCSLSPGTWGPAVCDSALGSKKVEVAGPGAIWRRGHGTAPFLSCGAARQSPWCWSNAGFKGNGPVPVAGGRPGQSSLWVRPGLGARSLEPRRGHIWAVHSGILGEMLSKDTFAQK